jgi:hypothetical protein
MFVWVLLILIPTHLRILSKNLYTLSGYKRLFYPDSSVSPDPMKVLSDALAFDLIAFVSGSSQQFQFVTVFKKPNDECQLDFIWHKL